MITPTNEQWEFADRIAQRVRYYVEQGESVADLELVDVIADAIVDEYRRQSSSLEPCGKQTHVHGTNGGTMPCGSLLNGKPYYCGECSVLKGAA